MGTNPTKAADNIYCRCRKEAAKYNDKLNSRDGAAELLGISASTLADYELGITKIIPADAILRMADLYNAPELRNHYYTVPGCNTESGQTQFLTQFEPVITQDMLLAADYDLVALGHIHRPQMINGLRNVYYSGAVNAMNFNDEGQDRGFGCMR